MPATLSPKGARAGNAYLTRSPFTTLAVVANVEPPGYGKPYPYNRTLELHHDVKIDQELIFDETRLPEAAVIATVPRGRRGTV